MSWAVGYSALSHNMEQCSPHRPFGGPLSFPLPFHFLSHLLCCTSWTTVDLVQILGPPLGPSAAGSWDVPWMFPLSVSRAVVAPVLLLGSFLTLGSEMATRLQNQSMKKLSQQSSEVRKGDFSLVAVSTECLSLWGKWEETSILKSLIEWWLVRTVHHRETYSGVNRCLFYICSHGKKLARAQQVIPIWYAVPGNNNWQVPVCVQLLKNYHPAWYYPSALRRLVL